MTYHNQLYLSELKKQAEQKSMKRFIYTGSLHSTVLLLVGLPGLKPGMRD